MLTLFTGITVFLIFGLIILFIITPSQYKQNQQEHFIDSDNTIIEGKDAYIDENTEKKLKTTLEPDTPYEEITTENENIDSSDHDHEPDSTTDLNTTKLPHSSKLSYVKNNNTKCPTKCPPIYKTKTKITELGDPPGPIPDDGYKDADEQIALRGKSNRSPKPVLPDGRAFDIINRPIDNKSMTYIYTDSEKLKAMITSSKMRNHLSREADKNKDEPIGQISSIIRDVRTI